MFHFWGNWQRWEHHCDKEDFMELTRKYGEDLEQCKILTLHTDTLNQLQQYIEAHGSFPRKLDKQQELSEEQKKEKKLYGAFLFCAFLARREINQKHCTNESNLISRCTRMKYLFLAFTKLTIIFGIKRSL